MADKVIDEVTGLVIVREEAPAKSVKVDDAHHEEEIFPTDSSEYRKMLRDEALQKGALSEDGKFWMNEKYAKAFAEKIQVSEMLGRDEMLWVTASRNIEVISLQKAKTYLEDVINKLDKAYFGYTLKEYKDDAQ